jgi:hypothetical protein
MVSALLLLTTLAASPPKPDPDEAAALAQLLFTLGDSPLKTDDLLYRCGKVSACGGACGQTLRWIVDGHDSEHRDELCAALKRRDDKQDMETVAAAWVRQQLVAGAKRLGATFSALDRARASCGLGRLKLGPAAPDACVVAEIDLGTTTLSETRSADVSFFAAFCSELESCAGPCRKELEVLRAADLASLPLAQFAASAKADGCGAFADLPAAGDAQALVTAKVNAQLRDFGVLACKRADAKTSAALSCALARLGATAAPGPCGVAGATCPPPPPRKLPSLEGLSH